MKKAVFVAVFLCGLALVCAAGVARAASADFFTDVIDETSGQYMYAYGGGTTFEIEKTGSHSGEGCLKADFDCTQWSGAVVGRNPLIPPVDLTKFNKPAVEFWVKGAAGGENFEVLLIDADDNDGNKTEVGVMATPAYVKTTKEWQKVAIPFNVYPKKGQYWDNTSAKMVTDVNFNPAELKEIKFAVGPKYNIGKDSVIIYIDDLKIVDMP
ncbi:MAG: carbohydrate binding domain-containing protein [Candidatus Omnitrophica bacterium]|nr:carbohydrate binding domain-containing protein [Candidatus Omnitrophota bacterium]MDD5311349.1 carbohydrate binding domain-containing protein [Candidatus Omnitrophota bacterium]MDD5546142.1 carbohydrate binding domain-containing protein [Candidatus Omnitrophota bacterium]